MKTSRIIVLPALALAVLAPPFARAEKEIVIRRLDVDDSTHGAGPRPDELREKESVTYLGVETAPVSRTLGAQLGLVKDTGLVVVNVLAKSPAADVLKEDDVLTKLDDQLLVNMAQLGALVRAKKDGDEVRLTLVRTGKELTVKARLAVHEVPKHANAFFFHNGGPGPGNEFGFGPDGSGLEGLARVRELPGMGVDDAREVLRMIEHERGNFMNGPRMRVIARGDRGSTILDLPKSNVSYSDDEGSIEIKVDDGKRTLTVKDAKGKVAYDGPVNTEEERAKLPPDVARRLHKFETDTLTDDVDRDFKPDGVTLPPAPAKTKIGRRLDEPAKGETPAASRPF